MLNSSLSASAEFRKGLAATCHAEGIALLSIASTKNPGFINGYGRILVDFKKAITHTANGSKMVVCGSENKVTIVTIRKSLMATNDPRMVMLELSNFPANARDDALLATVRHSVSKFKMGNPQDVLDIHVYLAYKTNRRTGIAYAWVADPELAKKICVPGKVTLGSRVIKIGPARDRSNSNSNDNE